MAANIIEKATMVCLKMKSSLDKKDAKWRKCSHLRPFLSFTVRTVDVSRFGQDVKK